MRGEGCRLQLPVLEDMHAVQIALTQVLDALADDRIDPKRAGLRLHALQQAATNLNSTPGWKAEREQVEFGQPLRALETSDVATQYDLPKGVDSDLPPEAALQAAEQPADSPQKAKQHVRLARMPERAASQVDNYYHIPKKLDGEMGDDEGRYRMARMLFDMQQEQQEEEEERAAEQRRSRPPRAAIGCLAPAGFAGVGVLDAEDAASPCGTLDQIPATADVA